MPWVKSLDCSRCETSLLPGQLYNLCPDCLSPLLVRYHLDKIAQRGDKHQLILRRSDMWRYYELLPVDSPKEIVTLGEGWTPLLHLRRLGELCDSPSLYLKDESQNPTGTFKARGLSVAVSMALKMGVQKVAIPTAGNAGGALAAYGAKAGLKVFVFMPKTSPVANIVEARMTGAQVELTQGTIADSARRLKEREATEGWFDISTLREPYRLEGKKTMGYELAEQLKWILPDVLLYPTGGGTGLIGIWKAFEEMEELGWIGKKRPRMVAVQSEGCAPIVKAFEKGWKSAKKWTTPTTFASGVCVPQALGDFLILAILRESSGKALAVSDKAIYEAVREVGKKEGALLAPEGAACWAALKNLRKQGWIESDETVVILNTGTGLKYIDSFQDFENSGNFDL